MKHKLLLADDSVTIQRVIELTFADEDVQVIAVGDGQQAIEQIGAQRPDIVLADVGMPERDGYEVGAYVKGDPSLAHIPVVLLTGAFEPVDEPRARAIGCDGVLVKPFEPQAVINRVRDLLAGRRPAALWATAPGLGSSPSATQTWSTVEAAPVSSRPASLASTSPVPPSPATPPTVSPAPSPADTNPSGLADDSLDEYFDRLDAAFANLGGTPPAPVPPLNAPNTEGLGVGDLDQSGSPSPERPTPSEEFAHLNLDSLAPRDLVPNRSGAPVAERQAPAETAVPRAEHAPADTGSGHAPPLAEAFAALLAAEQGAPLAPILQWPGPQAESAAPVITDALVDELTRRILERMTDQAVRDAVADVVSHVAERLVREEIERIKAGSR